MCSSYANDFFPANVPKARVHYQISVFPKDQTKKAGVYPFFFVLSKILTF